VKRRSRLLVVGMLALVTSGCVRLGPPPVGVRALQANLVFSVAPPPPTPPTIAPPVPTAAAPGSVFTFDAGPIRDQPVYKLRPALPEITPCPLAGPNSYPAEEATTNAKGMPTAGSYRWKRAGTYALAIAPNLPITLSGFEPRLVRKRAAGGQRRH